MRKILALCALVLILGLAGAALALKGASHFGAAFTGAPHVEVVDLLHRPEEYLNKQLTIEGTVSDQCALTGCFFHFRVGIERLRIELGDLAEKIPQHAGTPVKVEGTLVHHGDSYEFLGTAVEFL